MEKIKPFYVLGIAIRTTNENGQAMKDIGDLWKKFMQQDIPGKINNTVYSIYTEYEKDFTKPYTTVIGCEVANLDHIPEGMKGITIAGGDYEQFTTTPDSVGAEWGKIWGMDLNRAYTTDFEKYGEKGVEIFIAIHSGRRLYNQVGS